MRSALAGAHSARRSAAYLVLAAIGAALALFVFQLAVEAARAQFAADPGRRSAVLAIWSAVRLLVRRPVRAFTVGAVGAAVAFGGALLLMALHLQATQSSPAAIALAWLVAQGAQLAVGWGRATRILGLADLSRADAAERARSDPRRLQGASAGVQVVHSATLSALEPPRSGASR